MLSQAPVLPFLATQNPESAQTFFRAGFFFGSRLTAKASTLRAKGALSGIFYSSGSLLIVEQLTLLFSAEIAFFGVFPAIKNKAIYSTVSNTALHLVVYINAIILSPKCSRSEMADKASVYASMFVRKGDQVLLVEQLGPDDIYPVWSVPGGGVEVGETPQEGAIRETWEETGVRVTKVGALTYVTSMVTRSGGRGIVLAFEANEFEATEALVPQLPDDYILRAEFLSAPDALHRLDQSPYRYIVEPMMAYLKGDARLGTLWQVIFGANESEVILTRN